MKFAAWTHPKTGEIRIYINGATGFERAYLAPLNGEGDSDVPELRCCGEAQSRLDMLSDLVENELAAMNGGERPVTFGDVRRIINA